MFIRKHNDKNKTTKISQRRIQKYVKMIKINEKHIPHLTFMLQIKCLGESKIRIINTSICDKEGHCDNWCKSVYASDDDECDSNYCYNYHGIYRHFIGPSLQSEQKTKRMI